MNESDAEDDDDDDKDDEDLLSPVLAPKQEDAVKEEPVETSPSKAAANGFTRATPSSKSSKAKRKSGGDDIKVSNGGPAKKVKTENESKPSSTSKSSASQKASASSSIKTESTPSAGPVTEEEIRAALLQMAPVTTQDLVAKFKARLKSREDKSAFADILKRISKIQKTSGSSYIVLREK